MKNYYTKDTLQQIILKKTDGRLSVLETFSIRFFMENRKPQNVKWPRPCGHVCSLQFTFERQQRLLAVSDLRQGFLPLKIVQPRVWSHELAFCIRLRYVCWIFDLELVTYSCFFWAIKVMHFVLMKNNKAALSNERVVQIDFIFQESFYYKNVFSSNPELTFFFNLVTELIT